MKHYKVITGYYLFQDYDEYGNKVGDEKKEDLIPFHVVAENRVIAEALVKQLRVIEYKLEIEKREAIYFPYQLN